jgi:uncharacterized repeat protein (TIGR03803 family)
MLLEEEGRFSCARLAQWLFRSTLFMLVGSSVLYGQAFSVIKSFGVATNVTGCNPACELVQDAAGVLYGTTSGGEGRGTVFKMRSDGSGFQVLKVFTNTVDGAFPRGGLTLSGSTLYGATATGGSGGSGTLFSMGLDGSAFTVLKSFSSADPGPPQGPLILSGGTLFGILTKPVPYSGGIFCIQTNGTGYTLLKNFMFADGAYPCGRLILSGSTLYGTVSAAFIGSPAVFSIGTNGSGYNIVRSFSYAEGDPSAGLMLNGGTFYGVTSYGGGSSDGTVFKMATNGSGYTALRTFPGSFLDGYTPNGPLAIDGSALYGVTRYGGYGGGTVFALSTNGTGYTILADLYTAAGDYPQAGLLLSGGEPYGTTYQGGNLACGTVFKLNTGGGGFSVLKHFGYSDAANPYGALLPQGAVLYGTTYQGGSSGAGTIFKVNRDGTGYTVMKSFGLADGANPAAGLVSSGNVLYGTTSSGGSVRYGTVFSVNNDGTGFTVVRSFAGGSDGAVPYGALLTQDGALYGTTYSGGASNLGTVFQLTTNGANYSVLWNFAGGADGANPYSALILAAGRLYGTTSSGGISNCGTIFRLNTDGSGYAVLKQFTGGSDGTTPYSGLVSDGSMIYGTTFRGGSSGSGTVFRISMDGTGYTVLQNLTSAAAGPRATLVLNGATLYGVTSTGGQGNGAVFSLRTDGTHFTILKTLSASDGAAGWAGLALLGSTLYGSTSNGGELQAGSIYALTLPPCWIASGPPGPGGRPFTAFISGVAGSSVAIEASGDLKNWVPLQTNVLGAEPLCTTDLESPSLEGRFYRAAAPR